MASLISAMRDGAAAVPNGPTFASTVFVALTMIDDPGLRAALIAHARDRWYDEDFGVDNDHAAQLTAAGGWRHA